MQRDRRDRRTLPRSNLMRLLRVLIVLARASGLRVVRMAG